MTLTAESTAGFLLFIRAQLPRKYATDLRPIFRIGSPTGVDDCCKIGLRLLKGRCHGNHFLSNPRIFHREISPKRYDRHTGWRMEK